MKLINLSNIKDRFILLGMMRFFTHNLGMDMMREGQITSLMHVKIPFQIYQDYHSFQKWKLFSIFSYLPTK